MENSIFRPMPSKPIHQHTTKKTQLGSVANPFSHHLQEAINVQTKLTVSKHAKERLSQRDIHIDQSRWEIIEKKVAEAKKMGVKDSLVLLQDAALIVSAKNNTVITAMARDEASTQIFTNINGTIIIE
ncbi:TIGR02530 family flagellar biosynthesis protein [Bacillus sp. CGMCC 1.16607]|uniref:TIGR02530 family flagellar biosynthesis protein n=1 Tax=Bacillus sp. CGMCC 1.16607 TaxID=3351842 RepID=UPI003640EE00